MTEGPHDERGPIPLDIEAIAHTLGIPRGTVRQWASKHEWTKIGTERGRGIYDLREARATYAKLRERNSSGGLGS